MSTRPGRSGLVANEINNESSGLYSAVYLVPGGASSSYSGDCSLDDCEEGKPLLSSSEITSDSIKRNKMAENAPKTTPGLNETVQEFKAREDRDPEGLNNDVRINFEEIIAEPEGYHSSKYIWHLSNEVYRFFKDIMYQVFSLIFGVPLAAFWGLIFAFVACTHVWFYSPLKRSHKIKMGCVAEFWSVILKVVFNPFFESIGKCFGSISITKKVERV